MTSVIKGKQSGSKKKDKDKNVEQVLLLHKKQDMQFVIWWSKNK